MVTPSMIMPFIHVVALILVSFGFSVTDNQELQIAEGLVGLWNIYGIVKGIITNHKKDPS
jgi:hypothetical protein